MGKGFSADSASKTFVLLTHMLPHIRITAFVPQEWEKLLAKKPSQKKSRFADADFWLKGAKDLKFFDSGRNALLACLRYLQLKNDDEVLIITTTQGPYISSCVTTTIGKVCLWSRKLSEKTRLALVIHEFGFPCESPEIQECKKRGIPILEDCAYALGTRINKGDVGNLGDYALYSLTKYFPVPFGGVLVSKTKWAMSDLSLSLSPKDSELLKKTIHHADSFCSLWNSLRQKNWNYFSRKLRGYGITPYFKLTRTTVPGAFVVKLPTGFPGDKVKKRLVEFGIEATEYYGLGGFYFPLHPFLTEYEKEYILRQFLKK